MSRLLRNRRQNESRLHRGENTIKRVGINCGVRSGSGQGHGGIVAELGQGHRTRHKRHRTASRCDRMCGTTKDQTRPLHKPLNGCRHTRARYRLTRATRIPPITSFSRYLANRGCESLCRMQYRVNRTAKRERDNPSGARNAQPAF